MSDQFQLFSDAEILALRPERNRVAPDRPYAFLVEPEFSEDSEIVDVATLFLTNSECPFRCLMCDLWKNTLERTAPSANIPAQIRYALDKLPDARQIKLYNSGNFFDPKAIPPEQHAAIAHLVKDFERVIVENHPKLTTKSCLEFRDLISPAKLEIALGLETCHPQVLESLNKGMTLFDFERAAKFLASEEIAMRTFILLRPPFLSEEEGVEWALRSIEYAFNLGINCCSLVPTRDGNGIMEKLGEEGTYCPPQGASMEYVLEAGIKMQRGRVFMDLWDAEQFFRCESCRKDRIDRLNNMNLSQQILPKIQCSKCE